MGNAKAKTKRGAAKRFKATASGYKRKSANRSHILTKMTPKRKRHLRGVSSVNPADQKAVKRMLGDK